MNASQWATLTVVAAMALAACQTQPDPSAQRIATARQRGRVVKIEPIAPGAVHVDGDLTEWGSFLAHGALLCPQLDTVIGQYRDQPSAAGVALKTDGQALYLAIRAVDPSVVVRDPAWTGDCVELFIDVRPESAPDAAKRLGGAAYGDGVYQLVLTPPKQPGENGHWSQANRANALMGEIEYVSRLTADGYTIEARIPLASLNGITAKRLEQPIGFGLVIDDINRVAGRNGTTARLGYAWCANGDSWHDPSTLGLGESGLTEPAQGTVLRAVGGRYTAFWDGRQIDLGLMVPANTPVPDNATTLTYGIEGQEKLPLNVTWDRTPYPSLGFDALHGAAPVTQITSGKYLVETTFPGGKQVQTRFEGVAWHATTAPAPRQPAALVLPGPLADGSNLLHSGWKLTPAGKPIRISGDMPVRMLWADGGKHLLVATSGFTDQGVHVIDVAAGKETKFVDLGRTFVGMCALGNNLLVSGGNGDQGGAFAPVHVVVPAAGGTSADLKDAGALMVEGLVKGKESFVSGLAAGKDGAIFLANIEADEILKVVAGKTTARAKVGYRPYGLALSPDGAQLAITNWGDESVTILSAADLSPVGGVAVGNHPNDLLYAKDGRLFVANAGSNSVSVIQNGKVIETIITSLDPQAPVGSTPLALAINSDGLRLYVANADNNSVTVVDTSTPGKSRVLGFIPTGWYPTALALSADNHKLYVGIGKGLGAMRPRSAEYIPRLFEGAVSEIDLPDEAGLEKMTAQVIANTPKAADDSQLDDYAKMIRRDVFPKIKHILFIIRENRTYDQVLGDLDKGNGDPNLAMFGKDVTPNAHRLAHEFVLLDNLYCSGEVSQDGHQWCNAAYATDFTQKAWIQSYSGRASPKGDDRMTASPGGYLWNNCAKHGKTYRSYGEFAYFESSPDKAPVFDGDSGLKGHACVKWSEKAGRDPDGAKVFIEELQDAEKTGQWPQYMVMSLPEDHTAALTPGRHTPVAMVASNDQALGMIVDAVSRSRFWKDTAIFVIEDDAQDGHDHVDAHRTVGFIISPYTRRTAIDSTMYTTVSMLRTMEMILDLPPMTQFDSAAPVMYRTFAPAGELAIKPYANLPALVNLDAKNPRGGADADASAKLDWSKIDKADPVIFNAILWRAWKPNLPEPAPVRRLAGAVASPGDPDD